MKLLLDENMPVRLVRAFAPEHEAWTVRDKGWSGLKNGELLRAMIAEDIRMLVTVDRSLQYQLPLERYNVRLVLLRVVHNKLPLMLPLVPEVKVYLSSGNLERVKVIGLH